MKKKYPTYIDETAILYDTITVSAGVRGCQIELEPNALISYVDAKEIDLI